MADRDVSLSQYGPGLLLPLVLAHLTALVVAAAGVIVVVFVGPDFDGTRSARSTAVINQALFVALWGLVTNVCLIAVAIRARWLWTAAIVWITALLATTPWRWPGSPVGRSDAGDVPIWLHSNARPWLWANALLVVWFGVRLAWRRGKGSRQLALALGASVVMLLLVSTIRVGLADRAEQPTPTAAGAITLTEAEADEVWSALPVVVDQSDRSTTGRLTIWGEEQPSTVVRNLPTVRIATVFSDSVEAAERTGWEAVNTSSSGIYQRATFRKTLRAGPAKLTISMGRSDYVRVTLVAALGGTTS